MDHQLGRIDLINWQGRRNRRIKQGVTPWTVIIVACAVFGATMMAAQAAQWLHWTGLLACASAVTPASRAGLRLRDRSIEW